MTDSRNWLVVMALQLEAQDVFEQAGIAVLYTGVGKINAAMTLTRALAGYRHAGRPLPRVINFGSAGSTCFATGTIVACTTFHQRDMDVSGLGFAPGITPYEDTPDDWQANLHRAAEQFLMLFRQLPQQGAT
jgi:adenosylhomocysteine nucleosidase